MSEFKQNSPKDYNVKKSEEGYVHLEIQRKEFDKNTGKPLFKSHPVCYTPREYSDFLKNKNGFTIINYLHLPEGVEKEEGGKVEPLSDDEKDFSKMKRSDLDEYAIGVGVDPSEYKKIGDLRDKLTEIANEA